MRKHLLVANLEAYSQSSPDAVLQLANLDLQGLHLQNESIALESATSLLEGIVNSSHALVDRVNEKSLQEILGPVAIDVLGSVDYNVAKEASIALEDDSKSFWVTLKEKVKKLWEAIVEYAMRFWKWLRSFSIQSKSANEANKQALDKETKAIVNIAEKTDSSSKSIKQNTTADTNDNKRMSEEQPTTASDLHNISIEVKKEWAMQNAGWKVADVIRRIDHYCREIVPHAKTTAKQMREITQLSKFNLSQIKKRMQNKGDIEIVSEWRKAAEMASGNYVGESKFINSTPVLIGFTRGPGGYRPCDSAEGIITFRNVGEIKALSDRLKAYGDASVKAISEMVSVDSDVDRLMKEAETFVRGLGNAQGNINESTLNRIMPLMRQVMFRQIDMVREYTTSYGFKSQANGVKLLRAIRLQLITAS